MANRYTILVVDDDLLCLSATRLLLSSHGYQVETASNAKDAMALLQQSHHNIAIVVLDYRLGDRDGSEVAQEILALKKDLYVVIHSGDGSREALRNCWGAGAVGFVEKSEPPAVFLETIKNWCAKYEATHLTVPRIEEMSDFSPAAAALNMIGRSSAIKEVAEKVARYRPRKENVLIVGETGTGKERVARAFIENPGDPFLVVNCAAYNGNSELMESELFGYTKGAFTGANKDQRGLFEEARGGIVFLDEIHTLSERAQQKLLRVLQEKTVRPVGSNREYQINFRLIAAAKPEIDARADEGTFLPDFFERINVLRIEVAPLRERKDDIEPLVSYFCRKYEAETGQKRQFLYRTLEYFKNYAWPRNVRELENAVLRLCIDVDEPTIRPEHLDARFFAEPSESKSSAVPTKSQFDELIREEVSKALAGGLSQREAARRVGMPESTLRRALKKWGVGSADSVR